MLQYLHWLIMINVVYEDCSISTCCHYQIIIILAPIDIEYIVLMSPFVLPIDPLFNSISALSLSTFHCLKHPENPVLASSSHEQSIISELYHPYSICACLEFLNRHKVIELGVTFLDDFSLFLQVYDFLMVGVIGRILGGSLVLVQFRTDLGELTCVRTGVRETFGEAFHLQRALSGLIQVNF